MEVGVTNKVWEISDIVNLIDKEHANRKQPEMPELWPCRASSDAGGLLPVFRRVQSCHELMKAKAGDCCVFVPMGIRRARRIKLETASLPNVVQS